MRAFFAGRLLVAFLAIFSGLMLVIEDVEARRLGGGRSVGRQYDRSSQREATPPAKNPQQGAQPAPRNRFGGMLGGLAAGLGIAWLLSHFGLDGALAEALGSVLVFGGLAFLALFLAKKFGLMGTTRAPSPAYAGAMGGAAAARASRTEASASWSQAPRDRTETAGGASSFAAADPGQALSVSGHPLAPLGTRDAGISARLSAADMRGDIPEDFNSEHFAHAAAEQFVQLQSAWDAGDLVRLRDFTTPELFTELQSDIAARGGEANHTEVVSVTAEVLAVRDIGNAVMASLRYSGSMREDGAGVAPFEEVWHLVRSKRGRDGWLLAGIEQTAEADGTEAWGRSSARH